MDSEWRLMHKVDSIQVLRFQVKLIHFDSATHFLIYTSDIQPNPGKQS